jgi:hypothetical protein
MTTRLQLSLRVGTVVTSVWSVWTVQSGRWWWCLAVTMLRFRDGAVVVTAVARLGFPGELAFAVVDDLESYFAGYRRLVRSFLVPWSK